MATDARIDWIEDGAARSARWHSESGMPPPKKVVLADDTMSADTAYRLALDGTALLWRGDFQNARQLLQALARADGNQTHAGQLLGINRDQVRYRIEKFGLHKPEHGHAHGPSH